MRYITLEQCKQQGVIEHNEDDAMIELQANAAERAVENYLDRPLEELVREDGTLPEDVVQGILLFFASLYAQREGVTSFASQPSAALVALLKPYKSYVGSR